jgi:hypothetical protein
MIVKTVTYTDFNGNERTESFWFHLSRPELTEMLLGIDNNIETYIKTIIKSENYYELVKIFKKLLLEAYGEKSEDGRRFIKLPEKTKEFSESEAYSVLFTELTTNEEKASEFVNGLISKDTATGK